MTTLTYAGKATARWLGDLRRTGSFEESDLEELGSHLEDEVGQLVDGGLSEKEALWVAMGGVRGTVMTCRPSTPRLTPGRCGDTGSGGWPRACWDTWGSTPL